MLLEWSLTIHSSEDTQRSCLVTNVDFGNAPVTLPQREQLLSTGKIVYPSRPLITSRKKCSCSNDNSHGVIWGMSWGITNRSNARIATNFDSVHLHKGPARKRNNKIQPKSEKMSKLWQTHHFTIHTCLLNRLVWIIVFIIIIFITLLICLPYVVPNVDSK